MEFLLECLTRYLTSELSSWTREEKFYNNNDVDGRIEIIDRSIDTQD